MTPHKGKGRLSRNATWQTIDKRGQRKSLQPSRAARKGEREESQSIPWDDQGRKEAAPREKDLLDHINNRNPRGGTRAKKSPRKRNLTPTPFLVGSVLHKGGKRIFQSRHAQKKKEKKEKLQPPGTTLKKIPLLAQG